MLGCTSLGVVEAVAEGLSMSGCQLMTLGTEPCQGLLFALAIQVIPQSCSVTKGMAG